MKNRLDTLFAVLQIVTAVLLTATTALAEEPATPTIQQQFELAASQIKVFATSDYINNRDARYAGDLDATNAIVRSLLPHWMRYRSQPPQNDDPWFTGIVNLLQHEDPKVRTLAMLAIYHTRDPVAIDHLVDRLEDEATTFPKPVYCATPLNRLSDQSPRKTSVEKQSVSEVAERMLTNMLAKSLKNWRLDPKYREATVERFWRDRRDRKNWIGWFDFELGQATRGLSRAHPDTAIQIGEVIRQIELLPPIERDVTLLAVFGSPEGRYNLKQSGRNDGEDLVRYAAMRLGPDRLLRLLSSEALIDDPDLPKYLLVIQRYVYEHATHHLHQRHYKILLQLARENNSANAYIAAAHLTRSRASETLREAFGTMQGKYDGNVRARVMTSLWQLQGMDEADYIVDWYFQDRTPNAGRIPYRADLLDFMLDRFRDDDRQMLARIIRDPRVDRLSLPEHRLLARKYNRNLLKPIIATDAIENLRHPMGDSHFDGQFERAQKEFPVQTQIVLKELDNWRGKLVESVPQWLQPTVPDKAKDHIIPKTLPR